MIAVGEKIFAFLVVITMQTIYMKLANSNLNLFLSASCIVLLLILILAKKKLKVEKRFLYQILLLDVVFLCIPLGQILTNDELNLSATFLIVVLYTVYFPLCALWFYGNKGSVKRFAVNFSDVMYVITAITLVLYVVGQWLNLISPTGSVVSTWNGSTPDTYFYLLFTPQSISYNGFKQGRFSGMFAEPSLCAFMMCIALMIELFLEKKKISFFRIFILLVAMYVTVSMKGYMITLSILCLFVVTYKFKSSLVNKIKFLLSGVIVVVCGIGLVMLYQYKVVRNPNSVAARISKLTSSFSAFWNNPLTGNGFKSDAIGVTGGDTSVFSQVLQQGGLFFIGWYFYPYYAILIRLLKKRWFKCFWCIIIYLALIFVSTVTYTVFSVTVIAILWVLLYSGDWKNGLNYEEDKTWNER